jgi:hypothetical protein
MTKWTLPEGRTPLSSAKLKEKVQDYSQVTRVEVIDASGRAYTKLNIKAVELHLQDDARTLKLFISE